jgi:folate-binding protein YgfZ
MNYLIGTRRYEGPKTLNFNQTQEGFYSQLNHLSAIEFEGDQTLNFLQGQLTNHVINNQENHLQNNLLCNLKGQIIAKLRLIKFNRRHIIIGPKDLWSEVLKVLERPAALAKVTIKPLVETVYGIIRPNSKLEHAFEIDENCYLSLSPPPHMHEKTSLEWHYHRLLALDFEIYPETCRLFHPHDLQLEQKAWIHIDKGCYRGQEIIARMHYRGKSKYQLIQTEENQNSSIQLGQAYHQSIIVDYCPIDAEKNLVLMRSNIRSI